MRLVTLVLGVSLLTIVCSQSALSQDSTENVVQTAAVSHLSEAESKVLAEQAVAVKEKLFGPGHLKLAKSLNSLANMYFYQGKYAEAEPLYKRTLAGIGHCDGSDDEPSI